MDISRGFSTKVFLAAFLLGILLPEMVAAGCWQEKKCCKGKDHTCRVIGKRMNGSNKKNCFCDEYCLNTGDCCTDFKDTCKPVDCIVDEWEEWSECSKLCGWGIKQRSKRILMEARYGGKSCGSTQQKAYCYGTKCKVERANGEEAIRETAKVIPASYGPWRRNKLYDPFKDIRKNLFNHYSANSIIDRPPYCAHFEINTAKKACRVAAQYSDWVRALSASNEVCVECQPFAMKRKLGVRCKGHGAFLRQTHWNAIMASGCHGKWTMKQKHTECSCNPDSNVPAFILI